MKSCDKIAADLLERRDAYKKEQCKKRKKAVSAALCLCLAAALGFGAWHMKKININTDNNDDKILVSEDVSRKYFEVKKEHMTTHYNFNGKKPLIPEEDLFDSEKSKITGNFREIGNAAIISPDGVKYVFIGHEPDIATFGKHTFIGKIEGEPEDELYSDIGVQTGMYACENDPDRRILRRIPANSEWYMYYCRADLPELDLSPENCVRFELIKENRYHENIDHMTCNDGITNPDEIKAFLSDIKSGKKTNDTVHNSRGFHIYGYFKDEPNLAICFTAYDLPEKWLDKLGGK